MKRGFSPVVASGLGRRHWRQNRGPDEEGIFTVSPPVQGDALDASSE